MKKAILKSPFTHRVGAFSIFINYAFHEATAEDVQIW
jgi:hypothetical protein